MEEAPQAEPGRLTLIGTGHVFRIHDIVRDAVVALAPDAVFVELDRGRYHALLARQRGEEVPVKAGFVQRRVAAFQEDVASMYGAQVGEEMLAAVEGARLAGARCHLIDPPAQDTVRQALAALTWRERFRALGLMVKGGVEQLLPGRPRGRDAVEGEIRRYQEDPAAAMEELRQRFPSLHRVVIEDRDRHMAQRIRRGLVGRRHGVAVLGDGHVDGILRHLEDVEVETYRLADVREGRLPRPSGFRFGFDVTLP